MKDLIVSPVPAFIQIVCEVPTNSRVVGNSHKEIIRNVSDIDIMEFGVNVSVNFSELDKSPLNSFDNSNTRITESDIGKLNSARNFNVHGDTALYFNFTNQNLTIKRSNNFPINITPMPDIKTTKQGLIYVVKVITVSNSSFKYSSDIHDYVKQLKMLYSDSSMPEFHDVETKVIVNFLADNQHLLTNVGKSGTDAVDSKNKVYYIQAAVAYIINEKEFNEEDDLSVTVCNKEFMLSRQPLLEAPRVRSHYYMSLLHAGLSGECDANLDTYKQHAMLLYYNDNHGVFDKLFVNLLGKVKEVQNIKDPRKKEGFFTETLVKNNIGVSVISLDDIKNRIVKFIFTNILEAEASVDPEKTIEEQKQKHERELMVLNNEKIKAVNEAAQQQSKITILKDDLEKQLIELRHKIAMRESEVKHDVTMKETSTKHVVDTSKSEFDIAKYKRETTQEYVKNGALIFSGLLNLAAIAFLAKRA